MFLFRSHTTTVRTALPPCSIHIMHTWSRDAGQDGEGVARHVYCRLVAAVGDFASCCASCSVWCGAMSMSLRAFASTDTDTDA